METSEDGWTFVSYKKNKQPKFKSSTPINIPKPRKLENFKKICNEENYLDELDFPKPSHYKSKQCWE